MNLPMATSTTRVDGGVLHATFDAPPINLIGPEVVRDMVTLLDTLYRPSGIRVVVFDSADDDFLFPHVDIAKVAEYTAEAAKAGGPATSRSACCPQAQPGTGRHHRQTPRPRSRSGRELALACDIRFASRERAILGQPGAGIGAAPGAGGIQHLARALEVILSSEDVNADFAERYGWINRALPDTELDSFVDHLAQRIAGFPAEALTAAKAASTPSHSLTRPTCAASTRSRAHAADRAIH